MRSSRPGICKRTVSIEFYGRVNESLTGPGKKPDPVKIECDKSDINM